MATKLWAILLVFVTTILTSSAQILWKIGSKNLSFNVASILTNYPIMGGVFLYVVGGALLIISFRGGEVSVLYPIFAASYIWVTFLSYLFLKEIISLWKIFGIAFIIVGIAHIGMGSKDNIAGAI